MELFLNAAQEMFNPVSMMYVILGVSAGIMGGALPGVSSTMTVALLLPLTYTMRPETAIMTLAAIQVGSTYGGSIAASLLNVPGTPASAATALEGYPMTLRGEANTAVGLGAVASFFGSLIGVVLFVTATPVLVNLAMRFGPWEYFWFSMFGLVICANLAKASFLKGITVAVLGIVVATIGLDPMFGMQRFTFGQIQLLDGIALIPAMIGLYGMAEIFNSLHDVKSQIATISGGSIYPFGLVLERWWLALRVSVIGFLIGIIPGVGANIASWVGYDHAKSTSKEPEKFGEGAIEGLIGSECANNACVPGAYAPLLALAIPGDNITAMILGALVIYGVQPGPTFLLNQPHWLVMIAMAMATASLAFLIIGGAFGRVIARALSLPRPVIMAVVTPLCVIGSYAVNLRVFDIYIMLLFGLVGLFFRKNGFPIAPFLLGLVLGGKIIDTNFRRALMAGRYSFTPFFTRPISIILVIIILFIVINQFLPVIRARFGGVKESK